jgi:hypothetical protein
MPSPFPKSIEKSRNFLGRLRVVGGQIHKHADASYPLSLLSARRKWPRERCSTDETD